MTTPSRPLRPVRVKVCGIRRAEDALVALQEGAWALGFVFHRPSPRAIDPDAARTVIEALPPDVLTVGVFVDRPAREVNAVVERVGLRAAQLHGSENPATIAEVRAEEVWKAFRTGPGFDVEALDEFPPPTRILLDAFSTRAPGGTGITCDWETAGRAARRRPIILAGGLAVSNVIEALEKVRPEAIDVSSGLEATPGRKDPQRIREFLRLVRRWEHAGTERGST